MRDQLILIYSYLHGIWRYRWSALLISWCVVMIGWIWVYSLPNQYSAQAVMHVDTKSVMKPLLKGLSVDSDMDEELSIMSRLLLSRKNLEEVIRQTDMDLEANTPEAMDHLVENLASDISLEESGTRRQKGNSSKIYELSYQGESPELVYQVVSKLLNTMIETTLNSARTDTEAAQKFLDGQITEYEARLTAAEQRLAEFKQTNLDFMPDKTGGYYNRLQREQAKLVSVRAELLLTKRKLAEMRKQLKGELPLLDNSKALKLRRYREQLADLLTQFTEGHPDVQALRATIAETMANIDSQDGVFSDAESAEYNPVYQDLKGEIHRTSVEVETLKISLREKEKNVEMLKQSVDVIPEVEAKLAKLNRDYEITRERYLRLVERRESARLAQEVGQSGNNISFQIIDPPRVPKEPSGPQRLWLLSAVLLAGIAVGLGWSFLRYLIQPTFIDSSQIRNNIGLPVLGSVSLFLTDEHKQKRKAQLSYFLLAFVFLLGSYGGVMVFSESGSLVVNSLISSWKAA